MLTTLIFLYSPSKLLFMYKTYYQKNVSLISRVISQPRPCQVHPEAVWPLVFTDGYSSVITSLFLNSEEPLN